MEWRARLFRDRPQFRAQGSFDPHRDAAVEEAGKRLLAAGALELPALRVGHDLAWGEGRISAFLTAGGPAAALVP